MNVLIAHSHNFGWPEAAAVVGGLVACAWVIVALIDSNRFR